MGTTVNSATASAEVSVVKPRLSVQVVNPKVGTLTYQLPVAAIDYILIQVAAESDSSGRYQYKNDPVVVLDSKVISFAKTISDTASLVDAPQKLFIKAPINESVSLSEVFTKFIIYIRTFADSIGVADAVVVDTIKNLADQVVLSDVDTLDFSKGISDGVAINDDADIDFELLKYVMNMAFVNDTIAKEFSKGFAENISVADIIDVILLRMVYDTISVSDLTTLATELGKSDSINISDVLATEFAKTVTTDSISSTDAVSLEPSKAIGDTASIASSGYLVSQDYCDITYFAEDYVGLSRSFT